MGLPEVVNILSGGACLSGRRRNKPLFMKTQNAPSCHFMAILSNNPFFKEQEKEVWLLG